MPLPQKWKRSIERIGKETKRRGFQLACPWATMMTTLIIYRQGCQTAAVGDRIPGWKGSKTKPRSLRDVSRTQQNGLSWTSREKDRADVCSPLSFLPFFHFLSIFERKFRTKTSNFNSSINYTSIRLNSISRVFSSFLFSAAFIPRGEARYPFCNQHRFVDDKISIFEHSNNSFFPFQLVRVIEDGKWRKKLGGRIERNGF